jgi:hypothetical protein
MCGPSSKGQRTKQREPPSVRRRESARWLQRRGQPRILLMLALTKTKDAAEIQRIFTEY